MTAKTGLTKKIERAQGLFKEVTRLAETGKRDIHDVSVLNVVLRALKQGSLHEVRVTARLMPEKELRKKNSRDYFTPLADVDVPTKHQAILAKYRKLATDHEVPKTTPVCYRIRAGFTLKTQAPKAGPCRENYQYLQDWDFPDEPTKDCLVFWVPRILTGSTSKTKNQQINLLADLRTKLKLPDHHLNGFGKVGLVAGLILAHYKATQERIPLKDFWVRTDTCGAGGVRLRLGNFDDTGLHCSYWDFGDGAGDDLGVFALGVEALGH